MRALRSWLGLLGTVAILGLPASAGAQAVGDEFQVNTFTTNDQRTRPFGAHLIAGDGSGNFVVVWHSYGQYESNFGIFGQRYDSAGATLGSEFHVNSFTPSRQMYPSVASSAGGNFVVVWQSYGQYDSSWGIFGQRYDSAGAALGGEFLVNSFTTSDQRFSSVASDAAGNFVVVWNSYYQDGSSWGVFGQRYDSAGSALGVEFRVNSFTPNFQLFPSVASDASGNFVVVWMSYPPDGNAWGIFGQRYDSAGAALGSEFRINSFTPNNQLSPTVASDATGNFVVAWHSYAQDGDSFGIFAQRYDSAGGTLGSEFQVNSFTTNTQQYASIASDAAGNFVVAWASYVQDAGGVGIFGQRYDNAGVAQGDEFQINVSTAGSQRRPSVGATGSGQFVVAWESNPQDGNSYGVFGRRFDFGGSDATPPSVTVLTPNGGEKVFKGIGYVIQWTASDDVAIDHIDADYSLNGGGSWTTVPGCSSLGPTATMCTWATPGPTTSGFRARVTATDTSTNAGSDISNGNATIVAGTPSVTVTAPNTAGITFRIGDTKKITFNHNVGKNQPVLVELNRDYPAGSWETITGSSGCSLTSAATASTCNWVVIGPITNAARVRATWLSSTTTPITDEGNASFKIISRVTVTAPNTNVTWASGSTKAIKWTHNLGLASSFDIARDADGDLVCETPVASGVAAATATTGVYNWSVSGTGTTNRICVTNSANAADTDISDVAFKITP